MRGLGVLPHPWGPAGVSRAGLPFYASRSADYGRARKEKDAMGTAHDFIALPNTAQVQMVYNTGGGQAENVFHVVKGSAWEVADLNSIAATFAGWHSAHLRQRQAPEVSLRLVTAKDMSVVDSVAIEAAVSPALDGTHSGKALPMNVTLALKWSTGFSGRTKRGRTYHIGITDTQVASTDMSFMDTTALGLIVADYAELISEVNISDQYLAVASLRVNGAWRDTGVLTKILSVSADSYVDSQRRRLYGRGV